MKKILCKWLVITMLFGILPTNSVITPNLNVEASTTNSIIVHGCIYCMYIAHGGIYRDGAVRVYENGIFANFAYIVQFHIKC